MLLSLLKVAFSAFLSIAVLFFFTKLMGARQVSQLSLFDYINGITIGSIAAELALSGLSVHTLEGIIGVSVYSLCAVGVSVLCNKSVKARRLLEGKPVVLFDDGKLFEKNLEAVRMDVNEFLSICRYAGYFDLADIQTAVLETNGNVSILPKSTVRPVAPEDMLLSPEQDMLVYNVVIDGEIMPACLKESGNNETWLRSQLQQQHVRLSELILATCDANNTLTVYKKTDERAVRNVFL